MKIIDKFVAKQNNYLSERTPTIAFFGDSVTHGCFEIYMKNGKLETVVDTKSAYHEKVRKIFNVLYPDVPINIINAGISGDTADNARDRLQRDVISYNPDLTIVCFGLNDAMKGFDGIELYKEALSDIFTRIKKADSDVIFMTPNLVTDTAEIPFGDEMLDDAVASVIDNRKWFSEYIDAARVIASENNVPICDCNKIWIKLSECGVNINNLLSNRINHPTREMHMLFAYETVKTILEN